MAGNNGINQSAINNVGATGINKNTAKQASANKETKAVVNDKVSSALAGISVSAGFGDAAKAAATMTA